MRGIETIMFWLMATMGGGALALCLIMPPWLEYQAQLERLKVADAQVVALDQRLAATRKQIEHLREDPAYVLRVARQEFGQSIEAPGTQTFAVEPIAAATTADPLPSTAVPPEPEEVLPELSVFLAQVIARYPQVGLFVSEQTRPTVMGLSTVLLVTAIVLLGRPSPRTRRAIVLQAPHESA